MAARPFDLVLYGATGFVGRLAAAYLAQRRARQKLRWAIAGRDAAKLATLREQLAARASVHLPEIVVADSGDVAAVEAMAASTRVLITTAGPYALYGDAVVDACVHQKTHYADITGETTWVRRVIDRHHARAQRDGTRIVPFCGFDSVPSDLGTLLVVRHIEAELDAPCVEVKGYFRMMGGFNGGTLATNAHNYETGEFKTGRDPFLLNPRAQHSAADLVRNQDPRDARYDAAIGAWIAPFIMGSINTRVVRRSVALMSAYKAPYGPRFRYQEYSTFGGPLGAAKATALASGLARIRSSDEAQQRTRSAGARAARARPRSVRARDGARLVQDRPDRSHRRRPHRTRADRLRRRSRQSRDVAHPVRSWPGARVRRAEAAGCAASWRRADARDRDRRGAGAATAVGRVRDLGERGALTGTSPPSRVRVGNGACVRRVVTESAHADARRRSSTVRRAC